MTPSAAPDALLGALIEAPAPTGGYRLPERWRARSPALDALAEAAVFVDLGYECHTGADDNRKARDRFTLRMRLPLGALGLRPRLLAARWSVDRASADFLRATSPEGTFTLEQTPDPGLFRGELDLGRAPLSADALRALPSAIPGFQGLAGLFNLGRVRSLGARRHQTGALMARADLGYGSLQGEHARGVATSAGLRPDAHDDARWRGRSEAGMLHLYLMRDRAAVHLGLEPPMAGAWPDDPDEG